ncbi:hypothetical protein AM228_19095 [Planktothricoides sp. SR001]|nr:hypothetical protein AM228_19095 [Planktothricoides sp. SR001]
MAGKKHNYGNSFAQKISLFVKNNRCAPINPPLTMGINQENFLPDHSIARSAKKPMTHREKLKFRFIIL